MATIIDRNATVIARTRNFDGFVGKPAEPSLATKSRAGREGTWRDVNQKGVPVYGGFRRSELSGWSVALSVPVKVAEAPYWHSLMLIAIGSAALLLMGLALAFFIGRRISSAIAGLCDSAAALGRGEIPPVSEGTIIEVSEATRLVGAAAVERKRTEELRSRLAAIVEFSDDAIIGKTLDGTIVSWNKGAEKIYGYSSEEMVGRSLSVLVPPGQPDELPFILEKLSKGEHVECFNTRRITKDGTQIDVSLTISPIIDRRGNVTGASAIARDITEHKRAQNELRAQKEILQTIFDHIPVMINFVDEHGRIMLVNREWERTLGWTLEEIHENDVDVFSACYPNPQYRGKVLQFLDQSNGTWTDFQTRVKDGRMIETAWSVVHLSNGTFIGIGQDVTERKRAERDLRASQEQLRALTTHLQLVREQERTHIARELHDEIGQALTAIKLSIERAMRGANANGTLESALEITSELIGKVRDLSLELRPAMLDDLGLLAALNWHFDRFASRVNVKVDFRHSGLEGRRFSAEIETAAYRIVQQALTNVARHSGADCVEVSVHADRCTLRLRIEDRGTGFDAESLSVSATAGLSGMRERAIIVGGQLKIESAPGVGTVLIADLPITDLEVSEAIREQTTSNWIVDPR
jgi:PAS domain S-box-containing protein